MNVMKIFRRTRRSLFAAGALIGLAAVGLYDLRQSAGSDFSPLWSWSLHSWMNTEVDPSGGTTKLLYEPLALTRNLALISLAFVGSIFMARRALERQPSEPSATSATVDENSVGRLEATGKQLDKELNVILDLVHSYLEKNEHYTVALNKGQSELAASRSAEQIRAAVMLLISENQKMMRETEAYQRSLQDSKSQINELRTTLAQTHELNVRDSLTEVFSRRHFDSTLDAEISSAKESRSALSLIMADIDNFKKINDAYGHPVGDEVLKNFARIMSNTVKGRDTVARYGGEEFAIILPETPVDGATIVAEKIRSDLESKIWKIRGGPVIRITASFGVAQLVDSESAASLIKRADAKLYASKSAGRNRVASDKGEDSSIPD